MVDSSAVSTDSVKIFLNTALQDVPMRSDNVSEILKTVSDCLPDELRQRQLSLYVNGHDIHSLIPNYFKTKADRRKAFYNVPAEYTGKNAYTPFTPIVTNLDRPYSVKNGLQGKHIAMWQSHGKYFEQGLNRWEWQRARLFESVEDKHTQSFVLPYLVPMLENAGAYRRKRRCRPENDKGGHWPPLLFLVEPTR